MSQLVAFHSGVEGLDILLGGGFRPFGRNGQRASLTVLVRGPAGGGKTILAASIALRAAKERGGAVAYACIELLPEELKAQLEGIALPGAHVHTPFFDGLDGSDGALFAGLVEFDAREPLPTFLPSLDAFIDAVPQASVLVIDSVSTGYGLVGSNQRELADAVCKLSAGRGLFTIIIEEAEGGIGSPWPFATDVVIELRRGVDTRRELWVSKNRMGPAEGGWAQFRIDHARGVVVMPPAGAWRAFDSPPTRRSAGVVCGPNLDVGGVAPGGKLAEGPAIFAIDAESPVSGTWLASQLVTQWASVSSGTRDVVVGFGREPRVEDAMLVDGARASSVDELTTMLLASALDPGGAAPVVRIYDVDLGVRHLGDALLRALLVTASLLRDRGSNVIFSGWPGQLREAADLFFTKADQGTGLVARRRGQRSLTRVNIQP